MVGLLEVPTNGFTDGPAFSTIIEKEGDLDCGFSLFIAIENDGLLEGLLEETKPLKGILKS